jgi:hypothetical protein
MRFLGLVAVLAIIYYAYSKRVAPGPNSVDSAMTEFAQTAPATSTNVSQTAAPQPSAPATSTVRRPIDTTRSVLEQVKKRNGNGEF